MLVILGGAHLFSFPASIGMCPECIPWVPAAILGCKVIWKIENILSVLVKQKEEPACPETPQLCHTTVRLLASRIFFYMSKKEVLSYLSC